MGKEPSIQHPWQKTPAQLIQFAEELMNKESDFDHQVAFLLIDVGVETIFTTYLSLPNEVIKSKIKHRERMPFVRKGTFSSLIDGVRETAGQRLSNIDLNRVLYYHNIRNKLYHLGDGIVPTDENLSSYLVLAKALLERLLKVDLNTRSEDTFDSLLYNAERISKKSEIEDSVKNVKESLVDLKLSLAIAGNHTKPEWTKPTHERKLKKIWNEYPDEEGAPLWYRTENQDNRRRLFDELLGTNDVDTWLMDEILKDITYLYIVFVSEKIGMDIDDVLDKYYAARIFLKNNRHINLEKSEEIVSKSNEILSWVNAFQEEIEKAFWNE